MRENIIFFSILIAGGSVGKIPDDWHALALFFAAFAVAVIVFFWPERRKKRNVTRRNHYTRVRHDVSGDAYKHIA